MKTDATCTYKNVVKFREVGFLGFLVISKQVSKQSGEIVIG